jgi:predicted NACHT family NTPase
MVSEFQPYLESICATYDKWWELYTLTDAQGREKMRSQSSAPFEFGLTVQTVKKEEQQQEKVERFPVLEGIRKYADGHVLLVGRPGSGKSTALVRLMLELAGEMLPAQLPDQSIQQVAVSRTLTPFERQRLEKRQQTLQAEWDRRHEKLKQLRQANSIETQAADLFKLESQIKTRGAAI